ncbi:hypothetical protein JCM10207_008339 [Rhodosporidiobolus poonsookiae]
MTEQTAPHGSPPPKPAHLAFPTPSDPLDKIPSLIGHGVAVSYIYPHCDFNLAIDLGEAATEPPRWSVWLESHYRSFCPVVWALLGADEVADKKVLMELLRHRTKRVKEGAEQEEVDGLRLDEKRLHERRWDRDEALYDARQRYLNYCLSGSPPHYSRDSDALAAAEPGEPRLFSVHAPGTVWPLLSHHDPHPDCRCKVFASTPGNVPRLALPDVQTDLSRRIGIQLWGEDPHDPNADIRRAMQEDAERDGLTGAGAEKKDEQGEGVLSGWTKWAGRWLGAGQSGGGAGAAEKGEDKKR